MDDLEIMTSISRAAAQAIGSPVLKMRGGLRPLEKEICRKMDAVTFCVEVHGRLVEIRVEVREDLRDEVIRG